MANNKPYVKISSDITINVTSGLQHNDITKKDSDIPNRLKVLPMWSSCLIKQGIHIYPANVAEWPTVKALVKDNKLAIVGFTDEAGNEDEAELKREKAKLDVEEKKVKDLNLASLAGE